MCKNTAFRVADKISVHFERLYIGSFPHSSIIIYLYRDWLIHPWLSRERRDIFNKMSLLSHFLHFEKNSK